MYINKSGLVAAFVDVTVDGACNRYVTYLYRVYRQAVVAWRGRCVGNEDPLARHLAFLLLCRGNMHLRQGGMCAHCHPAG